jgi:hypothetical protein
VLEQRVANLEEKTVALASEVADERSLRQAEKMVAQRASHF